jgi:hypothetical protein
LRPGAICASFGLMIETTETFVSVRRAARALGVPYAWLLREVKRSRVPAMCVGRRWLVHLERTRSALAERAESPEPVGATAPSLIGREEVA